MEHKPINKLRFEQTQDLNFFQIDIPTYGTRVLVSTGSSKKFLRQALLKQNHWEPSEIEKLDIILQDMWADRKNCGARFTSYEDMYHIHLFPAKDLVEALEYITHETLHATCAILGDRGLRLSKKSEEAWTYLQQHLFSQIVRYIFKPEDDDSSKKKKNIKNI